MLSTYALACGSYAARAKRLADFEYYVIVVGADVKIIVPSGTISTLSLFPIFYIPGYFYFPTVEFAVFAVGMFLMILFPFKVHPTPIAILTIIPGRAIWYNWTKINWSQLNLDKTLNEIIDQLKRNPPGPYSIVMVDNSRFYLSPTTFTKRDIQKLVDSLN